MNAKERYNKIILDIEEKAQDPFVSSSDLAMAVAADNFMSLREINTVTKFLFDDLLLNYIRQRKMMAAYRYLVSGESMDITGAVDIADLGTHSSFDRGFKKAFGITPKEAYRNKDLSLFVQPLTWDVISCETENPFVAEEEVTQMDNVSIFGISKEQYAKAIEATDLAELYGFDSQMSNCAFELADSLGRSMKDTFRYVSELLEAGVGIRETANDETSFVMEAFIADASDPLMQFLFFDCDLHVDSAYELMDRLHFSDEKFMATDPILLHLYAKTPEMRFDYFVNAMAYYNEHADQNYDEMDLMFYFRKICMGVPKEEAFEQLLPMGDVQEPDDVDYEEEMKMEEYYRNDSIERMAEEDARWAGQRIDLEGDPDNAAYDEDDLGYHGPLDF